MNGLATDITVAAIGVGLLSLGLLIAGFRWDRHTERPKPVSVSDLIASPKPRPRHLWTGQPFTDPRDLDLDTSMSRHPAYRNRKDHTGV